MNAAMDMTGDPDPGGAPDDDPWLPADTADGQLPEDALADGPGPAQEDPGSRPRPRVAPPAVAEAQLAMWIASIAEQDERALAALYDATFTRVFGMVQRIVRSAAMAEEVVEDAYFQVWRQAVRFDAARGHALTWLLSMARSRAIDALRREGRIRHDDLADEADDAAGTAPAVDELLDLARHQADLHRALLRLGAQPRQLVSLAFFRGLSHEEIAQQTQLPLGTVKSQIRRALISLRQMLGDGNTLALVS